jgi:intein/homing endonuclease
MFIPSALRRMIGLIKVTENSGTIKVSGLPGDVVSKNIMTMWGSSKIAANIFSHIGPSDVSFNSFFAPDIVYAFQRMIDERKKGQNIRAMKRVIAEMLENTWLKDTLIKHADILDKSQLSKLNVTMREHQDTFLNLYNEAVPRYKLKGYLVGAGPGTGKAQPLYSMIKVPGGWKQMAQMKVGTEVITPKGTITTVTGVHPQGVLEIYLVEFSDGRAVECCGNHLWKVRNKKANPDVWEIKTTEEILNTPAYYYDEVSIPVIEPEDCPDIDLLVDPYLLGICVSDKSVVRVIPESYLHASKKQRLSLLRGLMDASGTVTPTGEAYYDNDSLKLLKTVQYLVRSLGGLAKLDDNKKQLLITYKTPTDLFVMEGKKQLATTYTKSVDVLYLDISTITYFGQQQAQCISVADEEHLYVTDEFTVTHNTLMGLGLGLSLRVNTVIVVCPKNAVYRVWSDTIKERFKKIPKFWTSLDETDPPPRLSHYIVHYAYLEKFIAKLNTLGISKPLILLDESHNLNEIDTSRVQAFIALCRATDSHNVVWLSGTPIKALGGELAPLFTTIDPMFTKEAQMRFSAIYGKASSRANDILAARLGRVTYKVDSKDVVTGSPIHQRIDVVMPTGHQYTLEAIRTEMRKFIEERVSHYQKNMRLYERQYDDILKFFVKTLVTREQKKEFQNYQGYINLIRKHYDPVALKEQALFCNAYEKNVIMAVLPKQMKDEFKNVRSVIKYYVLKVQGEALGQVLGKKRAQCNVEMLPHIGMEDLIDGAAKKTVIFTSYVAVVDAADAYLKKLGYAPILVYGKTNGELAQMVAKFEKDENANPLIATYQSLSAAVPLVMANQMIMLNSPFRSFEYDQATARCFRMGQDTQVYIADCFLDTGKESNISTRSRDILDWSRQQVEEIMNFKSPTFALENRIVISSTLPKLSHLQIPEWVMEELLDEEDGLESIGKVIAAPSWANW